VAALRATTPSENEVRLLALDSLKYALSAALFLGLQRCIVEGADALLQVEAATLGPAVARESATNADSGWHAIVTRFARSRAPGAVGGVDSTLVAEAISVLHVVVAEMREAVTSQTEAANVEAVAERFRGDMARELAAEAHTRRLLLEGDLTKVAAEGRGKHTVYRFFLFTDMLVYAEKIAGAKALFGGGGKFTVHQRIPLGQIRSVEACAELTAQGIHTGFRVSNGVKPLILYAGSEAEARAWKRQINEAVAAYVHGDHDGFAAMGGLGGTVASAAAASAAAAAVAASQGTQGHNTSIGSLGAGGSSAAAAAASARRNSVLTTFRRTSDIGIGAHAATAALREGLGGGAAGAHAPSATAPAGTLAGVGGGGMLAGGGRPGGSKLAGVAEARSPFPSAPSALRSGGGGGEGADGLATPGAAGSPGGDPAPPPRLRSDGSAAGTSASGTPVPPPAPPRTSLLTARPSLSTPEPAPASAAAAGGAHASEAGAIGLAPDSDDDEEQAAGQRQPQHAGGRPSLAAPVTASVSGSPAALDTVPEQGERTARRSARRRGRTGTEEADEGEGEGQGESEEEGEDGSSSADSPAHEVVGSPSAALSSSFPPRTFQPASPHAASDAAAGAAVATPLGAQQPRQLSLPGSGDGSSASPLPSPLPGGSPGSAGSRSAGGVRRSTTGPRRSAIGLSADSASPGGSAAAGGTTPAAGGGSSGNGAPQGGAAAPVEGPREGVGGEVVLIAASRSGSAESFYSADEGTPALGLGPAGGGVGGAGGGASTPALVAAAVAAVHAAAPPVPPPHGLPRGGSSAGGSGRRSLGVIVAPRADHGSSAGSLLSTLGDAGPVRDAAPLAAGGGSDGSPVAPAPLGPSAAAAASLTSSLPGAGPAPDRTQLFESIAELKTAFLHAVAFCRPLLSSDVAAGGTALGPAGTRQEGSFASPSATLSLHDGDKLSFYSYFKQATQGDCPDPSHEDDVSMMLLAAPPAASGAAASRGSTSGGAASARSRSPSPVRGGGAGHTPATLALAKAKRDAWRRCSGMRRREAMRAFVLLLDRCVPGWDAVSVMPGSGPA
jgi:hypothetical protein